MFGICERLTRESNWGYRLSPLCFARSVVRTVDGQEKMSTEPVSPYDLGSHRPNLAKQIDIDALAHDVGKFEYPEF